MDQQPLIIFDGKCHFCIGTVNFVLKRDNGLFRILPVQDQFARAILRQNGVRIADLNTVYVIDENEVYVRSRAAFRIFSRLPYPWKTLAFFRSLPVSLTDKVYKLIAKNRYIFGRSDTKIETLNTNYPERFLKREESVNP